VSTYAGTAHAALTTLDDNLRGRRWLDTDVGSLNVRDVMRDD